MRGAEIAAIFSDVGGVLGTNGWDRPSRRLGAEKFQLDWEEFEDRHELVFPAFEAGHLTLENYLDRTVFYRPRAFTRQAFQDFMFSTSQPYADTLAIFERLAASRGYLLATLNNESLELNLHRIEAFGLRKYFTVFFSSCFLGLKKPDEGIYRLALKLTQRSAEEVLFIDDRPLNVEVARKCGMAAICFESATQMLGEMRKLGISV